MNGGAKAVAKRKFKTPETLYFFERVCATGESQATFDAKKPAAQALLEAQATLNEIVDYTIEETSDAKARYLCIKHLCTYYPVEG